MNKNNPFLSTKLTVTEVGYDTVDSSWYKFIAYYPYYRLYYICSGSAKIILKNGEIDLKPGRLYFVPAFSVVNGVCYELLTHYWIHFNLDITTANYLSIYQPKQEIMELELDKNAFELILRYYNGESYVNSIQQQNICNSLVNYIFSRFLPDKEVNLEASRFIPVLQYIDAHLSEKISNTQLSEILYLNETYFSNIFTKYFGQPPKQYILHKRMNTAVQMLIESEYSVKEIADKLGYENEVYFNRIFHKYTGTPPGQYRKSFRNKQ